MMEDAFDSGARADAQVRAVLGRVLAQRRSAETALDYVRELSPGVKATCWQLGGAGSSAATNGGWPPCSAR
jgi:hypothetical protein